MTQALPENKAVKQPTAAQSISVRLEDKISGLLHSAKSKQEEAADRDASADQWNKSHGLRNSIHSKPSEGQDKASQESLGVAPKAKSLWKP